VDAHVYEGAPSPVVALLSTAPKAAAFALLLRVIYEIFPSLHGLWAPLMWFVAVLSMTVGNLAALRQENVKRMLAYSAIAHAATSWPHSQALEPRALPPPASTLRLCGHECRHLCRNHPGQR